MDQVIQVKFLQILLTAYQLGEETKGITSEQVVQEIAPQLESLLSDLYKG